MQTVWLCVSATATGFGIWATHFITMLAFSPGLPTAYNITLTFLSLMAAILLTALGLAVATGSKRRAWLGGAIVGGGIAAMHYIGMAAFEVEGRIIWDPLLVTASIVLGGLIGAMALAAGLRSASLKWKMLGAFLLTAAICGHHFTAMAAATILPDPTIEISAASLPAGWLAIAVASAGPARARRRRQDCATVGATTSRPSACADWPTPQWKASWFATAKPSSL